MKALQIGDLVIQGLLNAAWYEYLAVIAGIASVWFSKKENVLVYPVGLVNTTIYIFLSVEYELFGEATVNLYYTIMSIYGWFLWTKKDRAQHYILQVGFSNRKELVLQGLFFALIFCIMFASLTYLKYAFFPGAIPWADAFAAASAFTGMWLMAKKKVESWWWWIATNIASIPLYFVKGLVLTSFYYLVLLILAVAGLQEWNKRAATPRHLHEN